MNRSGIFLRCYRETGSVTKACQAADIDRSIHYRRLKADPKYAQAFAEAQECAVAVLEDECIRRATGVDEPVVYQGEFSYPLVRDAKGKIQRSLTPLTVRKYSDSLLMFLLRGAKPERYRERFDHTVTASVAHKFEGSMEDLLATYRTLAAQEVEQE